MATATAPTQKRKRSAAAQAEAPTLDLPGLPDEKLFDAAQSGDQRARDLLVERFLPLARRIALRYRQSGQPLDDLFQVASLGLVKAIDRFDHARGVAFTSYAVPTIMGEIKRYFRDFGWSVHVPRGLQERSELVRRAVEALHTELGRSPSVTELAERMELSDEEVLEALDAGSAYEAVSLDAPREDGEDGGALLERSGAEDPRYEIVDDAATVAPALRALSDRERLLLKLRFVDDLTQSEIAKQIGVSQMQVSRLLRQTLARLHEAVQEDATAAA